MTDITLRKSTYVTWAAPDHLWADLTDPARLAVWFHPPKAALALGAYEMCDAQSGDRLIWGDVLVSEPPHRLVYTYKSMATGDHISTVIWDLAEVPGGTYLTLLHAGLPQGRDAEALTQSIDQDWDARLHRLVAKWS